MYTSKIIFRGEFGNFRVIYKGLNFQQIGLFKTYKKCFLKNYANFFIALNVNSFGFLLKTQFFLLLC